MSRSGSSASTKWYSFYFIFYDYLLMYPCRWHRWHSHLWRQGGRRESNVVLSHSPQIVLLLLSFLFHFCFRRANLFAYRWRWVSASHVVIFDGNEEWESGVALSHSLIKENLRRINRRRLFSFSSFSAFLSSFFHLCFVVSSVFFVVFHLSLIRERRGALLFALNEESVVKVIAANSSRLTVFRLKY